MNNSIELQGNQAAAEDLQLLHLLNDRENAELSVLRTLEDLDYEKVHPSTLELLNEVEEAIVSKAETLRQQCIALTNLHRHMRTCGAKSDEQDTKRLLKALAKRRDECIRMAFKLSYFPPTALESGDGACPLD